MGDRRVNDIAIDDTQELRAYAKYMREDCVHNFERIRQYAHVQGCDESGFTGLFELLQPTMGVLGAIFDEVARLGEGRLRSGAAGLDATARTYDDIEHHNKKNILDVTAPASHPTTVKAPGGGHLGLA
jgi:hypothetical protein